MGVDFLWKEGESEEGEEGEEGVCEGHFPCYAFGFPVVGVVGEGGVLYQGEACAEEHDAFAQAYGVGVDAYEACAAGIAYYVVG